MLQQVEFESENAVLRGRFYKKAKKPPCVVMAHGTSATITMVADAFAEAIHGAGFSVLLYDHEMVHCNPTAQRAVFDRIVAPKEFYEIDGGHFGLLWHPGELFDNAARHQIAFLKRVLKL